MLGVHDQVQVEIPAWRTIAQKAVMPTSLSEFMARKGPMPVKHDTSRDYPRVYLRAKAVARCNGEFLAVYLCDISRSGIGFYSPIQIFPCELVELWLDSGKQVQVQLRNCVREKEKCYRCGASFVDT